MWNVRNITQRFMQNHYPSVCLTILLWVRLPRQALAPSEHWRGKQPKQSLTHTSGKYVGLEHIVGAVSSALYVPAALPQPHIPAFPVQHQGAPSGRGERDDVEEDGQAVTEDG